MNAVIARAAANNAEDDFDVRKERRARYVEGEQLDPGEEAFTVEG